MLPTAIHWICGRDLPEPSAYACRVRVEPVAELPGAESYRPLAEPADGPVWVAWFGGGFLGGGPFAMARVAARIAAAGMPVVCPTYRVGNPTAGIAAWPGCQDDAAEAVAAVRAHWPNRPVIGLGFSSGAYLALLTAFRAVAESADHRTRRAALSAVVNIAGVTDRRGLTSHSQRALLGDAAVGDAELEWQASPLAHLGPAAPPIYTLHGTADKTVPVQHAHRLDGALRAVGRPHTLVLAEGAGHDPVTVGQLDAIIAWGRAVGPAFRPDPLPRIGIMVS